jgi:glycosyltransferase involved in cell wall biosynthesis
VSGPLPKRLLLALQRRLAWLPAPLRSGARALVGGRLESEADVDDWSAPLVTPPDRSAPLVATPEVRRLAWPPAPPPSARQSGFPIYPMGVDLRCLLVTDSIDASGMDEFVAFLARRLPRHGIRCAVMVASDDPAKGVGALGRALAAEGVEVVDPGRAGAAAWMRAWRPDVLSVHGSADWALERAAELGVPAIETLHGMHNLFGAAPADVLRRGGLLAGVVSVSEMVRLQYLAFCGDDVGDRDGRIITIPNGVDRHRVGAVARATAREALGLDDQFLFVSLARHSLQKNGYALASAFDDVAAAVPGAHLLICGRSDDRSYTAQVVAARERMAHGDRLHLRGNTPHVATLLAAADAFALDSFFEGWSLSSMEALASGLPVVVSDVGGAREQLAGGPAKGALVANPLGDPLAVDWPSMSAARFRRQANRTELVDAMTGLARGTLPVDSRVAIAADSLDRFDDELCIRRHAHAIRSAAAGRPLTLPPELRVETTTPIGGGNAG